MRADAAAGSRSRIALAMARCSRTEVLSTGGVSTSPTCAMISGNCSRDSELAQLQIVGERHHRVVKAAFSLRFAGVDGASDNRLIEAAKRARRSGASAPPRAGRRAPPSRSGSQTVRASRAP